MFNNSIFFQLAWLSMCSSNSFSTMPKSLWTTLKVFRIQLQGSMGVTVPAVCIDWRISFRSPWLVILQKTLHNVFSVIISNFLIWYVMSVIIGRKRAASSVPHHCGWLGGSSQVCCPTQASQPREPCPNIPTCQGHLWLPADWGESL